jgi:hypothetical protein
MSLTIFQQNTNGIAQPSPAGLAPIPGPFTNQYQRTDIGYDYAIAGIPFIGGESLRGSYFHRIYQRSFSPIRKDQFDNQQTPGEQSIWGWWLRSQSTFHGGAGVQFLDTTQDPTLGYRYYYSEGVDTLSTPGQASLLPTASSVVLASPVGPFKLRSAYNGPGTTVGRSGVLALDVGGSTLRFLGDNGSLANYTMPGGLTGLANTLTDDGTNYYFADKTGIYKGLISSNAAATKIWNVPSTSGNYVLGWVKGRLVAGLDNNVYELVGGAPPTLPTPKFTHQNASYTYTDISEIGTAILVSGNAGGAISQIHKFALDSGGAMPTLTSGVVAAQMPYGEAIYCMYAYIGTYVGIGTNKGFRVAVADSNGNISYGPLVVQDPSLTGVRAITGFDRFMLIGNQGNKLIPQAGWTNPADAASTDGLIRVDLSTLTSTNSQPFANDLMPYDGATGYVAASGSVVNSVAPVGFNNSFAWSVGSKIYMTDNASQPAFQLKIPTGFIYTPKIRYNTLEPKHFKYVYLRHPNITDGAIDIYGQNPNLQLTAIAPGVAGSSTVGATTPYFISDFGNAQEWFQLKFILHRGTVSASYSPTLSGYQLRALPGVSRQVLIEIPLLCLDHETDRNGVLTGYDGFAWERLNAIEDLTASGNIVLLQDLNYGTANLVIVDDYTFEQQSPELAKTSSAGKQDSNAHGGYIILKCRVIS